MVKNLFLHSALALAPLFILGLNLTILGTVEAQPTPELGAGKLVVSVQGFEQTKGQACLSLFASAEGFPSKATNAVQSRCVEVTGNAVTITFEGLKPGSYAVAVFHDINKDGVLNQNRFGIPTERFGFSNNPRIVAGPPKFADSRVNLLGPATDIQIKLRGLLG
jgi:uncharacterized protein (DUF2141 family)